jgi:hypothetical protein
MDFPDAQTPPARPSGGARPPWRLLALALYALLLVARNVGAVAGGSDSSGYMNHARLLASGTGPCPSRTVAGLPQADAPPFLYVPLGFKPAWNGDGLVPTYPTGFALLRPGLEPLAGWRHAGDLTIILHSLGGLAATYALGRMLGLGGSGPSSARSSSPEPALPLLVSLQAMSDVPSLAWTTLAVVAALKSRERAPWALAAGPAIAIDVLLRPTNVLAFLPVAIALGLSPRRWILLIMGGLPGAIFLPSTARRPMAAISDDGLRRQLHRSSAAASSRDPRHYARWMPAFSRRWWRSFAVCRGSGGRRCARAGSWGHGSSRSSRSIRSTSTPTRPGGTSLPAAGRAGAGGRQPPCPSVAPFARAAALRPGSFGVAFAAALAIVAALSWWSIRDLPALSIGRSELRYGYVADWMLENVPSDAVCLTMQASGALFYYTTSRSSAGTRSTAGMSARSRRPSGSRAVRSTPSFSRSRSTSSTCSRKGCRAIGPRSARFRT